MLHSTNVTMIFNSFSTGVKQKLEFSIFAGTEPGSGAGVEFFGVGVESESKHSESDHLCFIFDFKLLGIRGSSTFVRMDFLRKTYFHQ